MIRSVLCIPESKLSELDGAPKLSAYDWNVLRDIVEILTPFEEATDSVQVDHVPSAGYVLPCIKGLSHHLKGMVSKYHSALVNGLKSSLERRMPYYEGNETYILAAMLDPRFKLRWCSDNLERKNVQIYWRQLLKENCLCMSHSPQTPNFMLTTERIRNLNPLQKRKMPCLTLCLRQMSPLVKKVIWIYVVSAHVDECLEATCVSMHTDPTKFWKDTKKSFPSFQWLPKNCCLYLLHLLL